MNELDAELNSKLIIPEIVEEEGSSSSVPAKVIPAETKTVTIIPKPKLPLKHRLISELAARCYPVDLIAKQVGLKPARVYHLLEQNQEIWEEIDRIIKDLFSEGDRMLANLRVNALKRLDDHISDTDKSISLSAIEKVLKVYDYSKGEGPKQAIMNFYGTGGKSNLGVESVDDFILRRRKERGLVDHEPDEDKDQALGDHKHEGEEEKDES